MLGDYTWNVIDKEAECLAQRFKAVSKNLANANTPGYARHNVSFEDQMREVMEQDKKLHMTVTDKAHIPSHPLKIKVKNFSIYNFLLYYLLFLFIFQR